MNAACSRILDEIAVFADLGTEPAEGDHTREGFVVRLFRNGDELALVFADDGTGKVVERCHGGKPRTHASYRALLASERFGDLRSWAAIQAMLLRETEIRPAIRVEGVVAGCDTVLTAKDLDDFLFSERQEESAQVLLIEGPAGIGKTKFIKALALARASSYGRRHRPLVLHVQSRGRVLSYLQDLIAFSLHRLRLSVTFDQLPVLARHGLVALAIDGFDELGDPDGHDLAWRQVDQTIDDLRGAGTLILAGRETFIGLERLKSTLHGLQQERDVVHGLTLRPPSPKEAQRWLLKKGWANGDVDKVSYLLEPDSYALRPFFMAKLAETEIAESIGNSPGTSLLPILINLMVERESQKFGDAVERVLSAQERRQYTECFLREAAQYMADDQTDIIGEIPLTWLVDMALPDTVSDPDIINLLKNRAGAMAFLAEDSLPGFRRFSHSQLFNYFLSAAAIASVSAGEIPKFVRRNIFSADFLAVFLEVFRHIANEDPDRATMFFRHAEEWAKNYHSIDRGARNLGAWVIAALPTMGDIADSNEILEVGPVDADETILRGTASPTLLRQVSVSQIDIRGADLRELTFEECALATAIVDDNTCVPSSFPVPKRLRVQGAADGPKGEDVWAPDSIAQWLDSHGRAPAKEDRGQTFNTRHEEMLRLLGRACRSSTFWIPPRQAMRWDIQALKFVNNPLWPTILKLLRKHGHTLEANAEGRHAHCVHIRQPFRLLANDTTQEDVRRFHEDLAATTGKEGVGSREDLMQKILAELCKMKTRMTYSAVACLLDVQPQGVGKWLGERRPEASWVVRKKDGRPSGYETWQCHPCLYKRHVIKSCCQLRDILGVPPPLEHRHGCDGGC